MKKYFSHISAFILTIAILFVVSGIFVPVSSVGAQEVGGEGGCGTFDFGCKILKAAVPGIVWLVLKFVALLTGLAGIILNGVVYLTVVKVSENYANIPAINKAWEIIRDVANMGFIFVLLYAAIQTILGIGGDVKKLIVNIIVVAILINFSLFFTKLVIDASNILAIMFYDAIAPEALSATGWLQTGLSNAIMDHLSLQSLYKLSASEQITTAGMITVGMMGSIMLLIAAFIFFAVAIMLIIRYVILIFVLILSPIAFVSFVLPQLKKYRDQWWNALSGQAFFAPIYFMLTWVTLYVLGGVMSSFRTAIGAPLASDTVGALNGIQLDANGIVIPNAGTFSMFVNFVVIIVFLITSLIIAKEWANKAGPGVAGLTKWAMGAAGGATLGMAGRFGRNTFGRFGATVGDSERLKDQAAKGGIGGMAARLALATGRKTGRASFDVRGTPLGGQIGAGQAQKGGFAQVLKDRNKKEKEFADSLGPSDALIAEKERLMEKARDTYGGGSREFRDARDEVDRLKGTDEKEALKRIKQNNRGASDERTKEILEEDRARPAEARQYLIKGLKDTRKEEHVESSLERSPTYRAAEMLEEGGRRIVRGGRIIAETRPAQAISKVAGKVAEGVSEAGERVDRVITNVTNRRGLRTFGRMAIATDREAANALIGAAHIAAETVRKIPTMIKAKNRAAIAEIRKGKKPVKDQLQEILDAEGERPTGGAGATPTGNTPTGDTAATPGGAAPTV